MTTSRYVPTAGLLVLAACLLVLASALPLAANASEAGRVEHRGGAQQALVVGLPRERDAARAPDLPVAKALTELLGRVALPGTATSPDVLRKVLGSDAGTGAAPSTPAGADGSGAASEPTRARRLHPLSLTDRAAPTGDRNVARADETVARSPAPGPKSAAVHAMRSRRAAPRARAWNGRKVPASAHRAASGPPAAIADRYRSFARTVPDWSRPVIAGLLLLALAFGLRAFLAGARARRLQRERKLLLDDVGLLQRALVPDVQERFGALCISAACCPAEGPGAGGDFYDAFQLADERLGLIIGDVAGHGPCAVERAAFMRYTIRAYVEAGLEPRAALKLAGSVLGDESEKGFVTVAVAVFDAAAGLLTYSLAGHPAPLLLGAGVRESPTVCSSPPLGLGLPTGLRQTTLSLSADAVACFFTDGLIEARVGDRMFGRENLERLLITLAAVPDAAARLSDAVDGATDDRAVCIVRLCTGPGRGPFQVEELELEASGIETPGPARFLRNCGVEPDEIGTAIDAANLAAGGGAALVRVWLRERGASVTVHSLDPEPSDCRHPGVRANGHIRSTRVAPPVN